MEDTFRPRALDDKESSDAHPTPRLGRGAAVLKEPAGTLLVILAIAFTAPLLTSLAPWLRLPALVLEIVFGILVGPDVLDLVEVTEPVSLLAEIGLATLIFLAGFEIDPQRVRGRPLKLSVTGWVMSVALGLACGALLQATGIVKNEVYVGLALTTTALGALLPILRDAGILPTTFGTHMLAVGSIGEFGPIIAVAVVLSGTGAVTSVEALVVFGVIAAAAIIYARRPTPPRFQAALAGTLRSSGQLYIRLAMLLIGALTLAAARLGLDVLLGAFTAGLVYRIVVTAGASEHELEQVESKLEALCLGYFIPIFFVVTGITFDLNALTSSPSAMAKVPLFLALLLLVRGLPTVLYRTDLPIRSERMALAFFSATGLPLIVAITTIGVEADQMRTNTAAALVGAGMLSVVLFPLIGHALLARSQPGVPRPSGAAPTPTPTPDPAP
jgi:Kef-type K+ transport system membrane component KefB